MKNLFFNPTFKQDFDWKGHSLRIGSVLPHNAKQISESLPNLSPESIHYRFLGSKKEFTQKELEYLTHLDGWNHYGIGIEERNRPFRGVAIVRMVRSSLDPQEAEVAITIIDAYQKLGLGTLLLNLITLAAHERNIERLSFTFHHQNDGIAKLIHRMGVPTPGVKTHDTIQLFQVLGKLDMEQMKKKVTPIVIP